MTREEIIQAISDDKMMPFIQPEQLAQIVEFVINNYRPSLPFDLDEAAEEFASNAWLHGGVWHEAQRQTFKAGAEWMAGQGISMPAHIFMPSGIKSVYDYSKGEYPAAVHLDGGGSLILEKRLQNFNHNEEVIVQIRKK